MGEYQGFEDRTEELTEEEVLRALTAAKFHYQLDDHDLSPEEKADLAALFEQAKKKFGVRGWLPRAMRNIGNWLIKKAG